MDSLLSVTLLHNMCMCISNVRLLMVNGCGSIIYVGSAYEILGCGQKGLDQEIWTNDYLCIELCRTVANSNK